MRTPARSIPPEAPALGETIPSAGFARRTGRILLKTAQAFFADNVSRLGAALAFYTTVAVAPLLVLAIAMAGLVFDEDSARQRVLGEIGYLAGKQAGTAVGNLQNPTATSTGMFATILGVVTLVFGALGVFNHLQDALNGIWRVTRPPVKGWRQFLHQRLLSLTTVLVTGFLLIVSLIASAALSWVSARTVERLGLPIFVLQCVTNLLSVVVTTFLFGLIFKLLPDRAVRWREVWLGAFVTALLFTAGKSVLGLYLGRASVSSAYGAAGSLIVLLLWCYYAAQIFFLGVEFTRVTALSRGGRDFTALDVESPRGT